MSGWFAVKRGITEHPVFKGDMAKIGFFVWMMENAAFKATPVDIGGKPHTVPRGALCFSQRFMATKAGMSVKALRTFLSALEDHGIIAIEVVKTGQARETTRTQVTLCNYEKYQTPGNKTETTGKQPGNKEGQGNNTPYGEPAATPPSQSENVSVLKKAVWEAGVAFLEGHGVKNPRPIIGKWLKAATASEVLTAIGAAESAGTQDPIPYMTKALSGGGNVSRFPSKSDTAKKPHFQVMREREEMQRRMDEIQKGTGT